MTRESREKRFSIFEPANCTLMPVDPVLLCNEMPKTNLRQTA